MFILYVFIFVLCVCIHAVYIEDMMVFALCCMVINVEDLQLIIQEQETFQNMHVSIIKCIIE